MKNLNLIEKIISPTNIFKTYVIANFESKACQSIFSL